MKRNKTIIIVLLLVLTINIYLMYKSSNNKQVTLDNVNLKEEINEMKGIAIMLEQDDGTYKESSTNTFPTDMKFNSVLSGCIDNLGNRIENSLTYENGIANVETSNTSYCYLYFDFNIINKMIKSEDIWESTLEDDGYRFVGTDPANYVCFGYSNATTDCDFTNTTNSDLYAYRIIGIFEGEDGKQHLKLIKKEALLNETKIWHTTYSSNVTWKDSYLNDRINGVDFLTNDEYISEFWKEKIINYNWKYGDITDVNVTAQEIYTAEKELTNILSSTKIGLLTLSDYSLGIKGGNNCGGDGDYNVCKTSWIHLSNNDSDYDSSSEWTMMRYGAYSGVYQAWNIKSNGSFSKNSLTVSVVVRPVFYLISDVTITGEGAIDNPYIIS